MNSTHMKVGDIYYLLPGGDRCLAKIQYYDWLRWDGNSFESLDGCKWSLTSQTICGYIRAVAEDMLECAVSTDKAFPTLPEDSTERKNYPLYRGLIRYFPKALAEVAKVSKIGNDKHNPGEEMHHARKKSNDHADCIIRHLIDMEEDKGKGTGYDAQGIPQVAYVAWRALALAQEWFEAHEYTVMASGAKND